MSAIKVIKDSIVTLLNDMTDIQVVYDYEKLNPSGFPAAFVTFIGSENEFFTNAENKRIFSYRILLLVNIGSQTQTDQVDQAEQTIQNLITDIIDQMDSHITLEGNSEVIFMEAAIGQPGYVEYEGGMARSGEITLKVHSLYIPNTDAIVTETEENIIT